MILQVGVLAPQVLRECWCERRCGADGVVGCLLFGGGGGPRPPPPPPPLTPVGKPPQAARDPEWLRLGTHWYLFSANLC
jgi:hypothetical protein